MNTLEHVEVAEGRRQDVQETAKKQLRWVHKVIGVMVRVFPTH
jgi:hypothetical protein